MGQVGQVSKLQHLSFLSWVVGPCLEAPLREEKRVFGGTLSPQFSWGCGEPQEHALFLLPSPSDREPTLHTAFLDRLSAVSRSLKSSLFPPECLNCILCFREHFIYLESVLDSLHISTPGHVLFDDQVSLEHSSFSLAEALN